jgi:nucleoside-diphosphate-sugar epimerase
MKPTLFVTGATGFVGRALLRRLQPEEYRRVLLLTRDGMGAEQPAAPAGSEVQWIRGDLLDEGSYASALAESDIVLHMAAATGNASELEHHRVNAEGTTRLVGACERAGTRRFVLVSTIAVKFERARRYHYAQSKRAAEAAVRASRLAYSIVRPTVVLGRDSPIWKRLASLAGAPIIPVIGDGAARVQPILVDDLVECLLLTTRETGGVSEEFDLGGPEIVTIEELLRRIHVVLRRRRPRVIHIPLAPLELALSAIELLGPSLPISSGQLAMFANDGVATPTERFGRPHPRMKGIDEIIALLASGG